MSVLLVPAIDLNRSVWKEKNLENAIIPLGSGERAAPSRVRQRHVRSALWGTVKGRSRGVPGGMGEGERMLAAPELATAPTCSDDPVYRNEPLRPKTASGRSSPGSVLCDPGLLLALRKRAIAARGLPSSGGATRPPRTDYGGVDAAETLSGDRVITGRRILATTPRL